MIGKMAINGNWLVRKRVIMDPLKNLSAITQAVNLRNQEVTDKQSHLIQSTIERQNQLAGKYDASNLHKYLVEEIKVFQDNLHDDKEVGLKLANFGVASEIHIRSIAFKNPTIIKFTGLDLDNNEVTLIQHISQVGILLTALKPVEETVFRIGFT